MKLIRRVGATSQIFQIFIADSSSTTGAGLTGLTNASSGLTAYYHRDTDTTATAISLVTMTVGTFTSSGFKEIDATNMPGWYQFCPPNAALASGAASVGFHLKGATNMAPLPIEVDLDSQVDVYLWNGTAVSSPATAGIPDVNIKNMNNIAATSITTINANQGTTQPINFTGTGGTALAKSDMVDIAGSAVSASTAQLGVNVVNIKGTASAGTAGYVGLDWGTINAPTTTQSLTGTTISTSQVVASVTGAVGSVTGNVGGNVTGSVGSVVAAVAITSNRKKGSSITVEFTMQDSTTGADKTGLTVASVISKDGGTFASTTNSVTEIANGWYQLVLTATEATANNISLQMTATGAINRDIFIQTQP